MALEYKLPVGIKIRPLGDKIWVELLEQSEKIGVLFVPKKSEFGEHKTGAAIQRGRILAVGPKIQEHYPELQVGKHVLVDPLNLGISYVTDTNNERVAVFLPKAKAILLVLD